MLGDREVDANARLDQDQMTTDLTDGFPSSSPEGFGGLFPGDVPQLTHALDGNHQRWNPFALRQSGNGLLVFCPQPGRDRLADVLESFFRVFALGDATGKCEALGDDPAVFSRFKSHVENHARSITPRSLGGCWSECASIVHFRSKLSNSSGRAERILASSGSTFPSLTRVASDSSKESIPWFLPKVTSL